MDVNQLIQDYKQGKIDGITLKDYETQGLITKTDRRKVAKQAKESSSKSKDSHVIKDKKNDQIDDKKVSTQQKKTRIIVNDEVKDSGDESDDKIDKKHRPRNPGRHSTCLLCRMEGHLAKYCRLNRGNEQISLNICFNCGSTEHILRDCKESKADSNLKFAKCFICKNIGHISKDCPENPNGLYPNGGCCHICQLKTHFSRDCPSRKARASTNNEKRKGICKPLSSFNNLSDDAIINDEEYFEKVDIDSADEDGESKALESKKKRKFTKYYSKPKSK